MNMQSFMMKSEFVGAKRVLLDGERVWSEGHEIECEWKDLIYKDRQDSLYDPVS